MVPEAGAIRAAAEAATTAVAATQAADKAAAMETVAEAVMVAGVATAEAAEDASGSRLGNTHDKMEGSRRQRLSGRIEAASFPKLRSQAQVIRAGHLPPKPHPYPVRQA
jgi:hypothetical protein